jgi:hypothetical protein
MTPDTPEHANVFVTCSGQISPGCPTADAILDGYSGWQQPCSPAPTISYRAKFAPIVPPTRTRDPLTFLRPGSFVLFQLDARVLAAQVHISESSELFERCTQFPTKRYVGLVLGSFGGENDSDLQGYDIAFVSKSLPPGSGYSAESDSFAIPIAPMNRGDIDGRRPLRPKPFPWTGCYQYTVHGARIVPTRTYPSAIEYRLNDEDFEAFDDRVALDRRTLSISDEEALLFEDMRTSVLLPVKVWQELTAEQGCHDPREFVEEVLHFREHALAGDEDLRH